MTRSLPGDRHLADYVLDRGEWRATCRLCGFKVSDTDRRQAASQFRMHIREAAEAERWPREVIDLRDTEGAGRSKGSATIVRAAGLRASPIPTRTKEAG